MVMCARMIPFKQRLRRAFVFIVLGFLLLCLVTIGVSVLGNLTLPSGPQTLDRLDPLDKARLSEALRLKRELGEVVWPGWAQTDIPVILWNRDYSFLSGLAAPPSDWTPVPGDTFEGEPYYWQKSLNPQNFAVRVGDRWAASMATKWETDLFLREQFQAMLPPLVKQIFPYRPLILPSEANISAVLHESFHVYQAQAASAHFQDAERVYQDSERYWAIDSSMRAAWQAEIDLLAKAVMVPTDEQAVELARQLLARRSQRRQEHQLDPALMDYERRLEWLEGLAKYVELVSWRQAARTSSYIPVEAMKDDPDFKRYTTFDGQWSQEIDQMKRQATRQGDTRFYYTGMVQAVLLDRLMPGWKSQIFQDGVWLEDLLEETVKSR